MTAPYQRMGLLKTYLPLLVLHGGLAWSWQSAAQTPALLPAETESPASAAEVELAQIHQLMAKTWHSEQQPLRLGPSVLQADLAIADWWWQGKGGRAVLKKIAGQWKIVLCGGAGVKQPALFTGLGLTAAEADLLVLRLLQAEAQLSAAELQLLDSFGATVRLDGQHAAHPH